jgi:hypothetical protein
MYPIKRVFCFVLFLDIYYVGGTHGSSESAKRIPDPFIRISEADSRPSRPSGAFQYLTFFYNKIS